MSFSTRAVRTAVAAILLLSVGVLSLALADDPCNEYAKEDNCGYGGCNLSIITECGKGKDQKECEEFEVTANVPGMFKCNPTTPDTSKCVPAKDKWGEALTTNCMRWTTCTYSSVAMGCVPDIVEEPDYCVAPYYETVICKK